MGGQARGGSKSAARCVRSQPRSDKTARCLLRQLLLKGGRCPRPAEGPTPHVCVLWGTISLLKMGPKHHPEELPGAAESKDQSVLCPLSFTQARVTVPLAASEVNVTQ